MRKLNSEQCERIRQRLERKARFRNSRLGRTMRHTGKSLGLLLTVPALGVPYALSPLFKRKDEYRVVEIGESGEQLEKPKLVREEGQRRFPLAITIPLIAGAMLYGDRINEGNYYHNRIDQTNLVEKLASPWITHPGQYIMHKLENF
jgi:hypothetical protein